MSEVLDLLFLAGIVGGGAAYLTNFHGFKDWVNSQLKIGTGPGPGPGPGPTGGTWYRANGPMVSMPNSRKSLDACGLQSGPGQSGGNRWETNVSHWMDIGYEVVVYFKIKQGTMARCGDGHIGLKHGGPNHVSGCSYKLPSGSPDTCGQTGTCCCWWDTGVYEKTGRAYIEIERSHNNNCKSKDYGTVGKLDTGQPIGFRWHISREGSGIRLIGWVDTSGQVGGNHWREVYNVLDTGQFMPRDYYSHITPDQNIEIRISHTSYNNITMLQGPTARRIVSGSSYTHNMYVSRYADLVAPMLVH